MSKKLLQITKDDIYLSILMEPSKSDHTIADDNGVSVNYVWNVRQKLMRKQDNEFLRNSAGIFMNEFQTCADRLKLYITELEGYKGEDKTITHSTKDGGTWTERVPLDPTDKSLLIKIQMDATKQLLHMAAQPRLINVVRAIRDQSFKKPDFNE